VSYDRQLLPGQKRNEVLRLREVFQYGERTASRDRPGNLIGRDFAEFAHSPRLLPTLTTVAPNWRPGDRIPLRRRTLRVVEVRDGNADEDPVLVVEDVSE
jgi:hypothetical protein